MNNWIRNPLQVDIISKTSLSLLEKEKIIDLSFGSSLKTVFANLSSTDFWISVRNEYPIYVENAFKNVLPLGSTYLSGKGFSSYTYIKDKYRRGLKAESDLRRKLSDSLPNFELLC